MMDQMIQMSSKNTSDTDMSSDLEISANSSMRRMDKSSSIREKTSNRGTSISLTGEPSPQKSTVKKIRKIPPVQISLISRVSSILPGISASSDTVSGSPEPERHSSRLRWISRMTASSSTSSMASSSKKSTNQKILAITISGIFLYISLIIDDTSRESKSARTVASASKILMLAKIHISRIIEIIRRR